MSNEVARHINHMRQLLRMEYEHEKEEFKRQSQAMGVARKVKRGMCWYPLSVGRNFYNSLNQLVVEVTRTDDVDIEHNFEYGRPVSFFTVDGTDNIRYFNFRATVSYADETRMVVVMPSTAAIAEIEGRERLGVQLSLDETSYQAMFEALDAVAAAKGTRLAELRDIMLGSAPTSSRDIVNIELPWLNASQQLAVNRVIATRDIHIVHGPPGTGKTTTLVEAINETLHREPQVMVCAQSNTAVDWICEKLVDRGINVLRIGNPSRVNDKMLSFTYERRFESHPAYPELWAMRKEMRRLRGEGRRRSHSDREALRNRLSRLRQKCEALEIRIDADLFNSAHVVASTLVSSNHRILYGHHFGTLFIDEAAQALEAACWIPIRKADRVVFAGDHQQLPPTVKCYEAMRAGLDVTLMQTVAGRRPEAVTMLDVQYRMSRPIMQFSSSWFYEGKVKAAPEVEFRSILDMDRPITWVDISDKDFKEEFVGESFGRINRDEARLLIATLEQYIERIGEHRIVEDRIDFGIISPYKAQVQYLRRCIKQSPLLRRLQRVISVNTVDGFQGQERDVIFISLVRSNDAGQIGFLSELRRMNVAMTRARMKLVIIGDTSTLGRHRFYSSLIHYITELE